MEDRPTASTARRWPLAAMGVLWLGLLAVEHVPGLAFVSRGGSVAGRREVVGTQIEIEPGDPEQEAFPEEKVRIGDIERMLGVRDPVPLGEPLAGVDEYGFRNEVGSLARGPELVVIGASLSMFGGPGLRLHEMLEERTGLKSYCTGVTAADPRSPPGMLFLHPDLAQVFTRNPPEHVVWTIGERLLDDTSFQGLLRLTLDPSQVPTTLERFVSSGLEQARTHVQEIVYRRKDTSPLNIGCRKLFHEVISPELARFNHGLDWRARATQGGVAPDAAGPPRPVSTFALEVPLADGTRLLIFTPGLQKIRDHVRTGTVEDVDHIVAGMLHVRDMLREWGTRLTVVLVPEKRTVYRRFLDGFESYDFGDASERRLEAVTRQARQAGLRILDLVPVYQRHSAPGRPWLFYPTDTHWTVLGRSLAADALLPLLR